MRRPRFARWIRSEAMRLAQADSFNLRKLCAAMQNGDDRGLSSAVMLYAHENGQFARMMSYVYDEDLAREFQRVEQHLGPRSVERLALRGIPMMSLPVEYREVFARYNDAYHAPELIAQEKHALWESTTRNVLASGITPTELARELHVDASNMSAYLSSGDTSRFTLQTIRDIAEHVSQ